MRRTLTLVLVLGMVAVFTACGEEKAVKDNQTTTTTEQSQGIEIELDEGKSAGEAVPGSTTTTTQTKHSTTRDNNKGGIVTGITTTTTAASQTISPKKNIRMDEEYVAAVYTPAGETAVSAVGVAIQDGGADGLICVRLEAMFESDPTQFEDGVPQRKPLLYGGKTYYRIGGGMSPYRVELTDAEIIIKQSLYEEQETVTATLVMLANGDLKVTETHDPRFSVGMILSTRNNYLN